MSGSRARKSNEPMRRAPRLGPQGRPWRTSRIAALALALAPLHLNGCSSSKPSQPIAAAPTPAPAAPSPPVATWSDSLAEQAQRDLEHWRRLQAQAGASAAHPSHAAPPEVLWSDAGATPRLISRDTSPGTSQPGPPAAGTPGSGTPGSGTPGSGTPGAGAAESIAFTTPADQVLADRAPFAAAPVLELSRSASGPAVAAPPASMADALTPAGAALTPEERLNGLLVDLARELYQQAADADMPMRELLLIAAAAVVDPGRALNADALPSLTDRERELLTSMQSFFIDLGKELAATGDPERIPAVVAKLRDALSRQPQLTLANATLCSRVEGFGKITPFEPQRFLAHTGQQVIVYVEVDKFTSELNSQGEYVTELAQQLVIYSDRDGIPVWQEDWQTAVDLSRNQRSDFFIRQIVTLPKALSVGQYHLKVRVRDNKARSAGGQSTRAEAEASIPFEMVADPKMAAGVH